MGWNRTELLPQIHFLLLQLKTGKLNRTHFPQLDQRTCSPSTHSYIVIFHNCAIPLDSMLLNGHLSRYGYTIENRKPHAAISLCMMTRRPVRVCVWVCVGVCVVHVCGCGCGTCVRVCVCVGGGGGESVCVCV